MNARARQRGFTLLELLVALAVFGFVLIALAQGTRFGLSAWVTDVRLTNGNDDLNTVDATVRQVIEGMNPGDELDPAPMAGDSARLDCLTELPNASSAMPVRRMRAALLVDGAHQLVLRWQPYLHAVSLRSPPAATDIGTGARCGQAAAVLLAAGGTVARLLARHRPADIGACPGRIHRG